MNRPAGMWVLTVGPVARMPSRYAGGTSAQLSTIPNPIVADSKVVSSLFTLVSLSGRTGLPAPPHSTAPQARKDRSMSDSDTIRLQDLSPDEIRLALEEAGHERRLAVQDFVERIGGLENARLAIHMLSQLEDAA